MPIHPDADDEFIRMPNGGYVVYAYLERIAIVMEAGGTYAVAQRIAYAEDRARIHSIHVFNTDQCMCWQCYARRQKEALDRFRSPP